MTNIHLKQRQHRYRNSVNWYNRVKNDISMNGKFTNRSSCDCRVNSVAAGESNAHTQHVIWEWFQIPSLRFVKSVCSNVIPLNFFSWFWIGFIRQHMTISWLLFFPSANSEPSNMFVECRRYTAEWHLSECTISILYGRHRQVRDIMLYSTYSICCCWTHSAEWITSDFSDWTK